MSQAATTHQRVRFEEVTPAHEYAAFFSASIESLVAHLNLPVFPGYDDLDDLQLAFLTLKSGQIVTLGEYLNSPQPGTSLYIDLAMENILQVVIDSCQILQVSQSEIIWLHPDFSGVIDNISSQNIERSQSLVSSSVTTEHEPIDCFNHALQVYPRQQFSLHWAMLQHNMGLAYFHRQSGDRRENSEKAIECFCKSLEIYTQQNFPEKWQINQEDLSKAQRSLQEIIATQAAIDHSPNPIILDSINRKTLSAFLIALAQQKRSDSLQAQLHHLSQQIAQQPTLLDQPINLLQPLLNAYFTLDVAYRQAYAELGQKSVNRSKGGPIDFYQEASTAEIINVFKDVCGAADSIRRSQQQTKPGFWQKLWQLSNPRALS